MDLRVQGPGPTDPFLGARDLFETEQSLQEPVTVSIVEDPDERTRVSHTDDGHELTISIQAATSAMARELALHEFAHMHRHERGHPSHTQSIEEVIYLALAGRTVERRKLTHCYQIANHMKDIYADDIWLSVAPGDKLVDFLESSLAATLIDRPQSIPAWDLTSGVPVDDAPTDQRTDGDSSHDGNRDGPARLTATADPDITAVNAAFALGLVERHSLIGENHRLYDLAHAAAEDAPGVAFGQFKRRFRSLAHDPDKSEYRKTLVDATRLYAGEGGRAAD